MTLSFGTPAATRGGDERGRGILGRRPDFDAVRPDMRGAGLRLHGGMGEKRHRIIRLDASRGAGERRRGIAVGAADLRRRRVEPGAHQFAQSPRSTASPLPRSSQLDAQRLGRALGPPPGIGHHRDRVRHAHDAAHAVHAGDRALVDRFERAAERPGIARCAA